MRVTHALNIAADYTYACTHAHTQIIFSKRSRNKLIFKHLAARDRERGLQKKLALFLSALYAGVKPIFATCIAEQARKRGMLRGLFTCDCERHRHSSGQSGTRPCTSTSSNTNRAHMVLSQPATEKNTQIGVIFVSKKKNIFEGLKFWHCI